MKEARTPNPAGREGKPFSLYPHTLDEVVQKMLATPPEPKPERKKATPQKTNKKR